jgi:hypothetical protein
MDHRIADIQARLASMVDELTEVSVDVLREAVEAGATSRPDIDRRRSQARRAVEKAARLLEPVEGADGPLG